MRPPDFRMEVWGFATPPLRSEGVHVVVTCGLCKTELRRYGVSSPAWTLQADLDVVVEHYAKEHFEETQP